MTPELPPRAELERQRADIEAAFRTGWVPQGVGQPRALTAAEYAEARKLITGTSSRLSYVEPEIVQAVREGAQPGDALPPRERRPFITGVSDNAEVILTGSGTVQRVAVLFSHDSFPGVRFGHRFTPPSDRHAAIWLMEEIETGGLHRMMRAQPAPDDAGIVWTTWGS
ncbi:MAG: hypothetical protein ACR2FU_02515 [Streptosporangiaceae bacterium]